MEKKLESKFLRLLFSKMTTKERFLFTQELVSFLNDFIFDDEKQEIVKKIKEEERRGPDRYGPVH